MPLSGLSTQQRPRYVDSGDDILVDVVQPSPGAQTQGVSLPGDSFRLPNGTTAYVLTVTGADGVAYLVQWQQDGYVVQLKLEGSGTLDTAKSLAGQVSLTK